MTDDKTDNRPEINPYLASDELRAKYPDVDFDQQKATEVRREIIKDYVRQHGRDMRFLLALIFTDPSDTGACLILRDMITQYREDIEAAQFEGGPAVSERMEVVKIRAIVYKFRPEANASETCINLQTINNSLVEKLFEKDQLNATLTRQLAEDQVEIKRLRDRVDTLLQEGCTEGHGSASSSPSGKEVEEDDDEPFDEFQMEDKKLTDKEKRAIQRQNHQENNEAMVMYLFEGMEKWFDDKKAGLEYCNCVRNALDQDEIYDVHTLRMLKTGKLTTAKILENSFAEDLRACMKPKNRPSTSGIRKRLAKLAENWKNM